MPRHALLASLFYVLAGATAFAQGPCSMTSVTDKVICTLPQVYGPAGLASGSTALRNIFNHQAHFEDSFLADLTPLNSAVGSQLAQLPLASPTAGTIFAFNRSTGVFTPSPDASFGPVLGERADTIGRHKLYVAFSYQYFNFTSLDGVGLKNLPGVYTHTNAMLFGSPRTCSVTTDNLTGCGYVRDIVVTDNRIDLRVNQYTTYLTLGLTRRVDVSVAIPIVNVHMQAISRAVIIPNSNSTLVAPDPRPSGFEPVLHAFVGRVDCPDPCLNATFANSRSASGIGDVTVRLKGAPWRGERAAIALGVDVRIPTGDELNFLGSGALGVKPFAVFSYRARFSPHASAGLQVNGSSILASTNPSAKGHLANDFFYSGGVDIAVSRGLTAAFDLLGERVVRGSRVSVNIFTDLGPCLPVGQPPPNALGFSNPNYCTSGGAPHQFRNLNRFIDSYNVVNASAGLKFSPVHDSRFLVTANALLKLNDGGLRARVVPLLGMSYTF